MKMLDQKLIFLVLVFFLFRSTNSTSVCTAGNFSENWPVALNHQQCFNIFLSSSVDYDDSVCTRYGLQVSADPFFEDKTENRWIAVHAFESIGRIGHISVSKKTKKFIDLANGEEFIGPTSSSFYVSCFVVTDSKKHDCDYMFQFREAPCNFDEQLGGCYKKVVVDEKWIQSVVTMKRAPNCPITVEKETFSVPCGECECPFGIRYASEIKKINMTEDPLGAGSVPIFEYQSKKCIKELKFQKSLAGEIRQRALRTDEEKSLCEWKEWTEFTKCSNRCGIGTKTRSRSVVVNETFCATPVQKEEIQCWLYDNCEFCQIHYWSLNEATCSVTCGNGTTVKNISNIIKGRDKGGKCQNLEVNHFHVEPCFPQPCPVDCIAEWETWSSIGERGTCNVSCGAGHKIRELKQALQIESYGGKICESSQTGNCTGVVKDCSDMVDCIWGGWKEVVKCSACRQEYDKTEYFSVKQRNVTKPRGNYGKCNMSEAIHKETCKIKRVCYQIAETLTEKDTKQLTLIFGILGCLVGVIVLLTVGGLVFFFKMDKKKRSCQDERIELLPHGEHISTIRSRDRSIDVKKENSREKRMVSFSVAKGSTVSQSTLKASTRVSSSVAKASTSAPKASSQSTVKLTKKMHETKKISKKKTSKQQTKRKLKERHRNSK